MSGITASLGLNVASSGRGTERFRRAAELVARADAAGFDGVWTGELYNRSATIAMANFALASKRVRIGSNIAYGVGRSPLIWAAEARDLDEMSGGRLRLGLGNGTSGMMENWHGVDGTAPAERMAELIEVIRKLWRLDQGPVDHEGRFYRVHLKPTTDTPPPLQEHLPIWIAGVNPRMVAVAGRSADGLIGHPMYTGDYVREVVRPAVDAAAAAEGRSPGDLTMMGILMCKVTHDVELGRRQLAYAIAQYAASKVYDRLFELHGWGADQARIREAARERDVDAMVAAVPDAAIDAIGVVCRPGELVSRVAEHAVDYDHLSLTGVPWGVDPVQAETDAWSILTEVESAAR
ncbi:putative F420-dependent oxidoreductase [Nocardioides sp. BE266]|uniref:LLM class flavin-dependent oxidoreductase n=1 Tax=Nocardioides sp. BE266 TaxID=2817725 RepID=UPI00285E6B08|nr:LLM class flavin-dependent oxidoreductase [Nocardioides sp. BE266]MDR7254273.1 putative F420-dependent oxidoreductase [Nocardioides sp. BE266]